MREVSELVGLVLITAGCFELIRMSRRSRTTAVGVLAILGVTFLFFFVGRPIYILLTRETSVGGSADVRYLNNALQVGLDRGLWSCAVFVWVLIVGCRIAISVSRGASARQVERTSMRRRVVFGRAAVLLLAAGVVGVVIMGAVIRRTGSFDSYVAGLSLRSSTLAGQAYVGYVYLPVAMLTGMLFLWLRLTPYSRWRSTAAVIVALGMTIALVTAFGSGGRAAVLLGVMVPFALLHDCISPWRRKRIVLAMAVAVVVFVGLSVALRARQFDASVAQIGVVDSLIRSFANLPETMLGQQEARPFDSILLLESDYSQYYHVPGGSTYASVWAFFVPRALWAEKPFGGGNAWFTENYAPDFYGQYRIETSISAVGEAWASFGWLGIIVVGFLLGLVAGRLHSLRERVAERQDASIALYAFCTPILVSFARGDAYHNVPLIAIVVALWYGLSRIVCEPAVRQATTYYVQRSPDVAKLAEPPVVSTSTPAAVRRPDG